MSVKQEKLYYPAVFEMDDGGGYFVTFPDLDGCMTQGDTLSESMEMAFDALCAYIESRKQNGWPVNSPSNILSVAHEPNQFVNLIEYDKLKFDKKYCKKAVRKNVTIPEWLANMADDAGISLSEVLKESLKKRLNVV